MLGNPKTEVFGTVLNMVTRGDDNHGFAPINSLSVARVARHYNKTNNAAHTISANNQEKEPPWLGDLACVVGLSTNTLTYNL